MSSRGLRVSRANRATRFRRSWWRRNVGASADRGTGPVEFAILALGMLTLAFMIVQAGLLYHARSVALGAATQGVNVARGYEANPDQRDEQMQAGVTHAEQFLGRLGEGLKESNVTAEIDRTNGEAVVITVTGKAISVLPGLTFNIRQSARGSVEQFVED
jgi:Flp pilus assembly protein TadG